MGSFYQCLSDKAFQAHLFFSKPHSAIITDVNGGSCDKVLNLILGFEAKRAAKYLIAII
jgi:hypothetical protein